MWRGHSQQSHPSQSMSIPTDSHRLDARWFCKPAISTAEQIGDLRRTRIFDSLDSGFGRRQTASGGQSRTA